MKPEIEYEINMETVPLNLRGRVARSIDWLNERAAEHQRDHEHRISENSACVMSMILVSMAKLREVPEIPEDVQIAIDGMLIALGIVFQKAVANNALRSSLFGALGQNIKLSELPERPNQFGQAKRGHA